MSDADDATEGSGEGENFVGFAKGGGEGLFDQDVNPGTEELRSNGSVMRRWDGDRGGFEIGMGGQKFGDRGVGGDAKSLRGLLAGGGAGVGEGYQLDCLRVLVQGRRPGVRCRRGGGCARRRLRR